MSHPAPRAIVLPVLALSVALAAPSAGRGQEPERPGVLRVDDLFEVRRVGDPQISPDGQLLAYTVTETLLEEERSETSVWMAPMAGGDAIRMTARGRSASRPRWSPDGRYLSFLSSRDGDRSQVWGLNRLGGEGVPLTDVAQGVSSYEWSPDGSRLLLSIRDAEPEEGDGASEAPKPWVIDRLQFKRDNVGYLDDRRTHLYVLTLQGGALAQITSGDFDDSDPAWSPDGRLVAFASNRTEEPDANDNTDIWIVAADNTDRGQTLRRVTANPGSDGSPAWSPDGRLLAYVTVTQPEIIWYATRHLAVVPVEGGPPAVLTEALDRNVQAPRFGPEGRTVHFVLEDSGERHLARIDVSGDNLRRLVAGPRRVSDFAMAAGKTAVLVGEAHLPGEVFAVEGTGLRPLTSVNRDFLAQRRLGEVRNVQFPSRDGTEIEGFIVTPPGYAPGLRYPTLLRIHGGPVSQFDFAFNFEAQLFAAHGYVVVLANPRGSSGYGQDFSHAIWADWGNKDFEDVMAAVDFAIDEGYADPERLGVGGWSYGGILTNYVITKTDRFKGAITGASEVLYRSNYGHDHYQRQWEAELGLPWVTPEAWERISPFNDVERIVTPTLVMGGQEDWNVPIVNSEQLYQALRRLGRTTQLVVYPGEHHGIRRPSFQRDRLERYLAWYDQHVKR